MLQLDPKLKQLVGQDGTEQLTPTEWAILTHLAYQRGTFCEPEVLALKVWPKGGGSRADLRALSTHIYNIRQKIKAVGEDRHSLQYVTGWGYVAFIDP